MKILKFLFSLIIAGLLVWALNTRLGSAPPLGKFLDPLHGIWQNAETRFPDMPERLDFEGLDDEVTIVYDSLMIPHIFAKNEEDLYFTQGYVAAQNRLWQMEFQTHAAAGRISEIIGPQALDHDRNQRRKGMVYGAMNFEEKMLEGPLKNIIESFTEGINAYISSLSYDQLPVEYKMLDYKPEPWTPLKSSLLLMYMSNTLNIKEDDLENTNALKLFGPEIFNFLYPDRVLDTAFIVNKTGAWDFEPVKVPEQDSTVIEDLVKLPPGKQKVEHNTGSNNWALHGSKTSSGWPLLANDPHLTLNLPSIWYVIHLNAPGINSMGATLPGAPGVIIGFNDSIAWGATNAQRDLVDWFKIEFRDDSRTEYKLDGEWVKTERQIEEIKIRGEDTFYDTVMYTYWGPVYYDGSFQPNNEVKDYAFRWIAHDPSEELMTFYLLNKADNFDDYREALKYFDSPGQNFAFASATNEIGITVQGKYPVRNVGIGKFLMDGSKRVNGWQKFIPFEHNVYDRNPERGFVSSANQYPVDSTYPYYIHGINYETYRNRRINHVLHQLSEATPEDLMQLQLDNFNLLASEALPVMMENIDQSVLSDNEKEILGILWQWDYFNNAESIGASYFEEWSDGLFPMIWDEIRDSEVALPYPETYTTIQLMDEQPESEFFDIKGTEEKENLRHLCTVTFQNAVQNVEEWKKEHGAEPRWADFKNTYIQHLAQLGPFSHHVKNGGNHNIVNATSGRNGPSWRMIVSLEPGNIQAWGVYPGGQSGNPGSPYYNNLLNLWAQGKYLTLQFDNDPENYADNTIHKQTFNLLNQ